ncbi:RNA-directed DNA polymerase, eukaryota [Tanacetum coccineum]
MRQLEQVGFKTRTLDLLSTKSLKWAHRFFEGLPTTRFIAAIHGPRGGLDMPRTPTRHSPWLDLVRELRKLSSNGINLMSFVSKKVGNGEHTLFWEDVWYGDTALRHLYPRLFLLESDKNASVASKFRDNSFSTSFRRAPRSGIEEEQFTLLSSKMSSVLLSSSSDRWYWSLDPSGTFTVKSAREFIDDFILPKADSPTRWVRYIPIKLNIFAWKVSMDKLPTRLNLSFRGIDIPSILCPVCYSYVESLSHLLFSCGLARHIMLKVFRWWELEPPDLHSFEEWLTWFLSIRLSKRLKDVFEVVSAGSSSSIPADYVPAGHVLISADRYRIC